MLYNKRVIKFTARLMLCTLTFQLLFPVVTSALTSGPSQPEVQSFEPVGTTDMVDLFTGDFVYNIPLLDVEGYPVNISYHSTSDMEQEASWVGLGWNINPGVINRAVRGMPDDFSGEVIQKTTHIKPEKNIRVGAGLGLELAGNGSPNIGLSADLNMSVNVSNYRGVSADIALSAGVNIAGAVSAGVNLGVSSQNGADIDYNLGLSFNTSQIIGSDVGAGVGISTNSGYNTRSGVKDRSFNLSAGLTYKGAGISQGWSAVVPIGIRNIIPVITNRSEMTMFRGQIRLGGEVFSAYPNGSIFGMVSTLKFDDDGSMPGYGYLYAQNATDASIMDFTRDRDGMFNETMSYLPLGNMTYDIYSVSGQGTGGSFRPFRNDFGSVYDPAVSSKVSAFDVGVEAGIGNLFEIGTDISVSNTDITSGPWDAYKRPFTNRQAGSIYENTYFKQAGEATEVNPGLFSAIQGIEPIKGSQTMGIPLKKPGSENKRDARGNFFYHFTGTEAAVNGVASSTQIYSYDSDNGFASGPNVAKTAIPRVSSARKGHFMSEVVQVQTDGRRYIYGLPAMNNTQSEVTFAVATPSQNNGIVDYAPTDASTANNKGRDNFYTNTTTPAYAHSFLLTSVLSTDYVDVKGDGPTDDDFGSFTKFNYSRKNANFGWKAPYGNLKAQHSPGFKSDNRDDKASFLEGAREQWLMHSIETKNFVAEFYTSARDDARGKNMSTDISHKLDSITLYNKHDRFINTTNAIPIKTVIFNYDYSLCSGVPNSVNGGGKLTLKKIFVRYGNSDKSMISPYQFTYGNNYAYDAGAKDRWGSYKPNNLSLTNADFPFVNQNSADLDQQAAAWTLQQVRLPSGGKINIEYEADDYAYVQDKAAMEMFMLSGIGNSQQYSSGNQLYFNKNTPNLFLYFNRRTASEKAGLSFKDNYLKGSSILYYNFETRLVDNAYEPIKGYAEVESVGACADSIHGFIKLKPVGIRGGGATLNHVTYTAINFGRYYLPHIIFPGNDPDAGSLINVLAGLQSAFSELLSFTKNPVKRMVEEGKAKEVKLAASFMRLNSPGMKKKGGGHRVKTLTFEDNWSKLAGGNSQDATYGKTYSYATEDEGSYGTISSGVASYEPAIGGDENPFREPVNYSVQSGSKWPPNDPVGVYQELPVGESLYPGAVVGYSKVTVKSIHQQTGRSAQGTDIYQFYTAKDFPIQSKATGLEVLDKKDKYTLKEQKKFYEGTQGFTLVFNDMHGKPKKTEHRIIKPSTNTSELVSYQEYIYHTQNGKLDNNVPVIAYDAASGNMKKVIKQVGYEADLTIDTREKKEHTKSNTNYINLNTFLAGIIPIPIPFWYKAEFNFKNEFRSVVATKVIQQYGILKEVRSSQEGALTTVSNEAFDPITGQALVTSVNNEFSDKEYSVTYPAYWGYKSMGPSYQNNGFTDYFDNVLVIDYKGLLPAWSTSEHYKLGDELLISYTYNNQTFTNNVWVTGFKEVDSGSYSSSYVYDSITVGSVCAHYLSCIISGNDAISNCITNSVASCSGLDSIPEPNPRGIVHFSNNTFKKLLLPIIEPRYKYHDSWPGNNSIAGVKVLIVRSGAKNRFGEIMQSYVGLDQPFDPNSYIKSKLDRVITISASEYSDELTAILPRFDNLFNPLMWDSLNVYLNGTRQIHRLSKEYAYVKNRDYSSSQTRAAGLFSCNAFWKPNGGNFDPNYVSNNSKYCKLDSNVLRNCVGDSILLAVENQTFPCQLNSSLPLETFTNWCFGIWVEKKSNNFSLGLSPWNFFRPYPQDDRNWLVARSVIKYSPWGYELENKDAIGNYTAAMYGYNHQLPVALGQNAQQHEMFSESFEDYQLLELMSNYATMAFSPFKGFFSLSTIGGTAYGKYNLAGSAGIAINAVQAHSGRYALATSGSPSINLNIADQPVGAGQPRYLPFTMQYGKEYLVSYWFRPKTVTGMPNAYVPAGGMNLKSNIIEGWQQAEKIITVPTSGNYYTLTLPANAYVDDIRIMPSDANMKSFVYHPVNQKLIATLDENNFASFYEYDQEGNLIRTKKETEKGIISVMESRSANVKGTMQ